MPVNICHIYTLDSPTLTCADAAEQHLHPKLGFSRQEVSLREGYIHPFPHVKAPACSMGQLGSVPAK